MSKPGVMLYFELCETIEQMDDCQKARLLESILFYGRDKQEPNFADPVLRIMWPIIRTYIQRDDERYARIREARRAASMARWHPEEESMQTDANACSGMQTMPTTTPSPSTTTAPSSPAAAAAPTTPAAAADPNSKTTPDAPRLYENGTHLPDIAAQFLPYSKNYHRGTTADRARELIRQRLPPAGKEGPRAADG